jgi:hypothetical protein
MEKKTMRKKIRKIRASANETRPSLHPNISFSGKVAE